jgi:rhamnosyltransferase
LNGRTRPVNEHWLSPLIACLDEDPVIAGACSRVVAHPDADLITRRDGELELSGRTVRERKEIRDWGAYEKMSIEERRVFLNFHTVSAALRADVFAQIQFKSVQTIGEDLLWAREAIENGWGLVHEPASLVYHSHEYGLRELFSRNVDDGIANRDIVGRALREDDVRPLVDALVKRDWEFLRSELSLEPTALEDLERDVALRRVAQIAGQWLGTNYRELPEGVAAAFSRIGRARSAPLDTDPR